MTAQEVIDLAIEQAFQRAILGHRQAVEHARRSVGQVFRWAAAR